MRNANHRPLGLTVLLFLLLGAFSACSSPKTKPGGTGGGSNTPPTVQSTVPTQSGTMLGSSSSSNSAAIEVTFNTEMMASSFEGGAFQVLADDNPVAGSVRMGDVANKVFFMFSEPMVPGQAYTVQLQGVRSQTDLLMASFETVVFGL